MDYEKLYEKALEQAKTIYQGGSYKPDIAATIAEILQNVFPEIKELEDERIRKAILNYFTKCWGNCKDDVCGIHVEDVIAWLEKQGKQKPIMDIPSREVILSIWDLGNEWKELTDGSISSEYGTQLDYIQKHWNESEYYLRENQGKQETICDKCRKEHPSHSCQDITALGRCALEHESNLANKVEQKFNEGDWIVNNNNGSVYQVTEIRNDEYCIWPLDGEIMGYLRIIDVDKDYHLWTIQDANDGDILMANAPFIFNGNLEGGIGCPGAHCVINTLGKFQIPKYQTHWTGHTITPATKDQCDTLLKAMTDAGWEFDFEKKELKKIKQKQAIDCIDSLIDSHPKDNWELVHEFIEKFGKIPEDEDELNVLVEYILKSQKPTEWSEEDEEKFRDVIRLIEQGAPVQSIRDHYTNWFKSLKERIDN